MHASFLACMNCTIKYILACIAQGKIESNDWKAAAFEGMVNLQSRWEVLQFLVPALKAIVTGFDNAAAPSNAIWGGFNWSICWQKDIRKLLPRQSFCIKMGIGFCSNLCMHCIWANHLYWWKRQETYGCKLVEDSPHNSMSTHHLLYQCDNEQQERESSASRRSSKRHSSKEVVVWQSYLHWIHGADLEASLWQSSGKEYLLVSMYLFRGKFCPSWDHAAAAHLQNTMPMLSLSLSHAALCMGKVANILIMWCLCDHRIAMHL